MRLPRGIFVLRGLIPGLRDDAGMVESRAAPGLAAHKKRVRSRGRTTAGDADIRAAGVPVFDRQAGQAELGSYLAPRR